MDFEAALSSDLTHPSYAEMTSVSDDYTVTAAVDLKIYPENYGELARYQFSFKNVETKRIKQE